MSRAERTGWRDEAYSRWHRAIPLELDFIDIDWQEVCATCHTTVLLYELAVDTGQKEKASFSTAKLARRAEIPAYCVLYRVERGVVVGFRIRKLWPGEEAGFRTVTADEWVTILRRSRCHEVQATPAADLPTIMPFACATCGQPPSGRFPDGSPRYGCAHEPLRLAAGDELF